MWVMAVLGHMTVGRVRARGEDSQAALLQRAAPSLGGARVHRVGCKGVVDSQVGTRLPPTRVY